MSEIFWCYVEFKVGQIRSLDQSLYNDNAVYRFCPYCFFPIRSHVTSTLKMTTQNITGTCYHLIAFAQLFSLILKTRATDLFTVFAISYLVKFQLVVKYYKIRIYDLAKFAYFKCFYVAEVNICLPGENNGFHNIKVSKMWKLCKAIILSLRCNILPHKRCHFTSSNVLFFSCSVGFSFLCLNKKLENCEWKGLFLSSLKNSLVKGFFLQIALDAILLPIQIYVTICW